MTYSEYQKLHEEWKRCDSIKRREEIESAIFNIAKLLLNKLNKVYAKYGQKFVDEDDYMETRGHLSLSRGYLSDGKVYLNYWDTWRHGGECDFNIEIPMKYLDDANVVELESDLKSKRIVELERDIQDMEAEIVNISNRKVELQKELEELKS